MCNVIGKKDKRGCQVGRKLEKTGTMARFCAQFRWEYSRARALLPRGWALCAIGRSLIGIGNQAEACGRRKEWLLQPINYGYLRRDTQCSDMIFRHAALVVGSGR
jgi:hypothetical protein